MGDSNDNGNISAMATAHTTALVPMSPQTVGRAAPAGPDPDPPEPSAPAMAFLPPEDEGLGGVLETEAEDVVQPSETAGAGGSDGGMQQRHDASDASTVVSEHGGGFGGSTAPATQLANSFAAVIAASPAPAVPTDSAPHIPALALPDQVPALGPTQGLAEPTDSDNNGIEVGGLLGSEITSTEGDFLAEDDWTSMNSDSGVGDVMSLLSSTTSLASSVRRAMLEENGRLYHGYNGAKYVLPNDEQEKERQRFQYDLCLKTFGGALYFAPITNVHRVLDIGTGLGMWPIQFGDIHLEADVLGVDIVPEQPTLVPPNVHFEVANLEEQWMFPYRFDYIHSCMMTGAFEDWPRFYEQAFENLNPGGWLEIQDIDFPIKCDDGSIPYDSALLRWSRLMMEAAGRRGVLLDTCGKAGEMMSSAGFVDVERRRFVWPINHWPADEDLKDLGDHVCVNFINEHHLEGICLALFTRYLGWTMQELTPFLWNVRRDFLNTNYHGYFDIWVTYGRKP